MIKLAGLARGFVKEGTWTLQCAICKNRDATKKCPGCDRNICNGVCWDGGIDQCADCAEGFDPNESVNEAKLNEDTSVLIYNLSQDRAEAAILGMKKFGCIKVVDHPESQLQRAIQFYFKTSKEMRDALEFMKAARTATVSNVPMIDNVNEVSMGPIHVAGQGKKQNWYSMGDDWLLDAMVRQIEDWGHYGLPIIKLQKDLWLSLSTKSRQVLKQLEHDGKMKIDGYR